MIASVPGTSVAVPFMSTSNTPVKPIATKTCLPFGEIANPAGIWPGPVAIVATLVMAVPLTLAINALRIIVVTQAHVWVIPLLPPAYEAFLHLLTGVAVFLPALIGLNGLLEFLHDRLASIPAAARVRA